MRKQLETYLEQLTAQLHSLPPQIRNEEIREIQAHLWALMESHIERGDNEAEAVAAALQQFGPPQVVGRALRRAWAERPEAPAQLALAVGGALMCHLIGCYFGLAGVALVSLYMLQNAVWPEDPASGLNIILNAWFLLITPFLAGRVASLIAPRRAALGIGVFYSALSVIGWWGVPPAERHTLALLTLFSLPAMLLGTWRSMWGKGKRRVAELDAGATGWRLVEKFLPKVMLQQKQKSPRTAGFTLIELLIVVTILSIVMATLAPVFVRVRESARRASCQSNLSQIMLAVQQYTQDGDGKYPPLAFIRRSRVEGTWYQIMQSYLKSEQVLLCPDDRFIQNQSLSTPHTSYNANAAVSFVNDSIAQAHVAQPATTVYLADAGVQVGASSPYVTTTSTIRNGCWILGDPTNPLVQRATDWCGPILRHLDTSNVAFLDGHVKAMKVESWYFANTPWLDPSRGGS